ncbi:hypothetical protein GOODEAATRI_017206, partial [Goodea atripinnis]
LRMVMTCALPALVLSISGRRFRIMHALIAAFCPKQYGWPGCPRWSSLVIGQSLSSSIRCHLDRLRLPTMRSTAFGVWEEGQAARAPGTVH